MNRIRFFRQSTISTDCDACGGRVDVIEGGACATCGRILCFTHLYGSWVARLRVELGGAPRCVDCRKIK